MSSHLQYYHFSFRQISANKISNRVRLCDTFIFSSKCSVSKFKSWMDIVNRSNYVIDSSGTYLSCLLYTSDAADE